ncbi:hypothetical protein Syun_027286 [Stephania yunnanensis]|uniref:Uncharacterized protein n=1 Tax=Stephania yunnanensis TaxID=152371 RepID=A0AAP0EHN7_9MAGN
MFPPYVRASELTPANYTYGHSTFTPNVDVYASPITLKDIYIFYVPPICACERVNPSELHIWA